MKIFDLFTEAEFNQQRADKMVKVQGHPSEPLSIANYTQFAQFNPEKVSRAFTGRRLAASLSVRNSKSILKGRSSLCNLFFRTSYFIDELTVLLPQRPEVSIG